MGGSTGHFGPGFQGVDKTLSGTAIGGALALGVVAFLMAGVMPILLGALNDAHRITVQQIGLAAMSEALATGTTAALAGFFLQPRRLRRMASIAILALVGLDLAMPHVSGGGVILVRALSGIPEGLLIWMLIGGMIARTGTPARWYGAFFLSATITQLLLSTFLGVVVLPRFGVEGTFYFFAGLRLLGLVAVFLAPDGYGPLPHADDHTSLVPPPRGWLALLAALVFIAGGASVSIFLVPLAHQAGLDFRTAHIAQSCLIAAQIPGSALATFVASRLRHMRVFAVGSVITLCAFAAYGLGPSAWVFIGATATLGFIGIFMNPFLMPMSIEADPSRRAAVQGGAAELLGLAAGPLLASRVVSEHDVHGALLLGACLVVLGVFIMAMLHFTRRPVVEAAPA